jgi:hypothetical protein
MNTMLRARVFAQPRSDLRRCAEPVSENRAAFWRINGFRARLVIWTNEEWEQMETPPRDAQLHPTGVWCALRLE